MPMTKASVSMTPCPHCGGQPKFRIFLFPYLPMRPRFSCGCGVSGPSISYPGTRQNAVDLWNKMFKPQSDDKLIEQMLEEGLQLVEENESAKLLQLKLEKAVIEQRVEELIETGTPYELANYLITVGYRITSRKYRMVSRIDRPDFVQVLAERLLRAPADFYVPGQGRVTANWVDYYRRGVTTDKLEVSEEVFKLMKSSTGCDVGYVHPVGVLVP